MSDKMGINTEAVASLINRIVNEAAVKLPCLSLGSREEVSSRLWKLVRDAEFSMDDGGDGCMGAWETDGEFVVAITSGPLAEVTVVAISLCLGETRITA